VLLKGAFMANHEQTKISLTPEITMHTPDLTIDNGEAPTLVLPIYDIYVALKDCVGDTAARAVLRKVMLFAKDVDAERVQGRHLGSSDLREALKTTIFMSPQDEDPTRYGLATAAELALALEVVASRARVQEKRIRIQGYHQ
jgi:hypothetical protein